MKRSLILLGVITTSIFFFLTSCEKKDTFVSEPLSSYMVMQPGKYIRYRLDSFVFINFGQKDTTIIYQAKDVVDAQISDENGRTTWRVIRYLRKFNSTNENDWTPNMAYQVVMSRNQVEVLEDNLRFIKLKLPVKEGYTWLGNSLLPESPYAARYQFTNDNYIRSWDYTYEDVGASAVINNKNYENTLNVWQSRDSINVPITMPANVGQRNHWVEQYAKDIGLIYKEVWIWEYQPPNGSPLPYKTGFGIKLSIIDHN